MCYICVYVLNGHVCVMCTSVTCVHAACVCISVCTCAYLCVYVCISVTCVHMDICVCVCGYLLHTFVYSAYVLSVCGSYPLHLHICYTRAPKHSACVVHVQFVFKGVISLHTCCKRV